MRTISFIIIIMSLTGCVRLKRDAKDFLSSTDVTFGASYDGVTVRAGRINGRNSVNVNVDPKEIKRISR